MYLVVGFVLVEEVVIRSEFLGCLRILEILLYKVLIHWETEIFVDSYDAAQISPAPCRHKALAKSGLFDPEEAVSFGLEVGDDRGVYARAIRIRSPRVEIRLHIDPLESVPDDDVEFLGVPVVFDRVSGGHDDPAFRYLVLAECLELQELQHRRCKSLRSAVDLVKEKYAFLEPCVCHHIVDGGDDLAHRVLGDIVLGIAISLVDYLRKSERRLPGVMGDRIADQPDAKLFSDLAHYSCFAYSRRPHQKERPLIFYRQHIIAESVLDRIGLDGIDHLLLGLCYVHSSNSPSSGLYNSKSPSSGILCIDIRRAVISDLPASFDWMIYLSMSPCSRPRLAMPFIAGTLLFLMIHSITSSSY